MLQIKVVKNKISDEEVSGRTCLSPPEVEKKGLERLPYFKYYNVLKRESRFAFRLNAAKNTNYIRKCSKLKLLSIKFPTKNSVDVLVYLPQEWN